MKKLIASLLTLCACGNWSNGDIEYLYALPQKDQLKSRLGELASAGQGLRRDPLLGAHSDTYENTKTASDKFNGFLDLVLSGLDTLRTIQPTSREENKRTWGPYADKSHPGFDVKAEIVKTHDKRFEWTYQARKRNTQTFVVLGGGRFVATESLRKGQGEFFFDAVAAHTLYGTTKDKPTDPDRVDVGYKTDADPIIVEVDFVVGGTTTSVGWDSNRYADSSAVLTYTLTGLADLKMTAIDAVAAWNAKTAGQVDYRILEGTERGTMARQCWDEEQKIVHEYFARPDGGVYTAGSASDCVQVPELVALPPLPQP